MNLDRFEVRAVGHNGIVGIDGTDRWNESIRLYKFTDFLPRDQQNLLDNLREWESNGEIHKILGAIGHTDIDRYEAELCDEVYRRAETLVVRS